MFDFFGRQRVYLDHASATPVLSEARQAMRAVEHIFANPGAIHKDGVGAKQILERSRETIARELGCKTRHIVWTSGLTESNNLAILGVARKLALAGISLQNTHWVVSSIEHDAVLECFSEVERLGGVVSHVDPDGRGIISPEDLVRHLRPETVFVSIGWVNNEIGVVQPLRDISRALRSHENTQERIIFHSDAGQGPLYFSPQVHTLGVDLLSLGAGKLYGSRGIGALYVHDTERLASIRLGGSQEGGLRAGTEGVVLAVGFARAIEIISKERKVEAVRLTTLRDSLARLLRARISDLVINGDLKHTAPHMLNISIPNVSGEYLTLVLDQGGISVSTKSACREGNESQSHVVAALGEVRNASSSVVLTKEERAQNTLRISMGRETSNSDVSKVVRVFPNAIEKARKANT